MSSIKDLVATSHGNSVKKGFHDLQASIIKKMLFSVPSSFTVEEMRAVEDAFTAQRLMLIVSELGEGLEAMRKSRKADVSMFNEEPHDSEALQKQAFELHIKDTLEDELADACIRIFDLAGTLGVDLEKHIELKAWYNSTRSPMHGKKF